jgi:Hpt domain
MKKHQRPPAPPRGESVTVQPGVYPIMPVAAAMQLSRALRDKGVVQEATQVLADTADSIKTSVLDNIDRMEKAAHADDFAKVYHESHEIRGLAGNGGLAAAARIANELCRYLDAFSELHRNPEKHVVRLHMGAISHAARATDDATRLGDTVAKELSQLVDKKLSEINETETPNPASSV